VAPSYVAWIVAEPGVEPAVASPFEPVVSLTVPLGGFNDVHVANDVRSCVTPLVKVPVAMNCSMVPGAMLAGDTGSTDIDAT